MIGANAAVEDLLEGDRRLFFAAHSWGPFEFEGGEFFGL